MADWRRAREWPAQAVQELRLAARSLRRAPGFSGAAMATLALGFGLVATSLALTNLYLVRGLPFPHADRLYHVSYAPPGQPEPHGLAGLDWAAVDGLIEAADASAPARFYTGEPPERAEAMGLLATRAAVELLDLRAALGRSLGAADFDGNAEPVVLLGYHLWRTRFAADPTVVGRTLHLARALDAPAEPYRIIGVLPADFRHARAYARGPADFVAPLREPLTAYMVRLRAGVPPGAAERAIAAQVRATATWLAADWTGVQLRGVNESYSAGVRPILLALAAAACIVLLIVCLNVAVLMLLRALRRQHDAAIRIALGASRMDILRMVLAEAVLISAAALVAGLVLARTALHRLAPLVEERLGISLPGGTAALDVDANVVAAVAGAGLVVAFGLAAAPLLAPWQHRLERSLRAARTTTDGRTAQHARATLVAVQIAASLALLTGCGLMVRSVMNLVSTDLGYRTADVVRARIALPPGAYPADTSFARFYEPLLDRLDAQPTRSALVSSIPFYEYPQLPLEAEAAAAAADAAVNAVSAGYFAVLGIAVREGRGFTRADHGAAEPVAITSESLARRLWPDGSAVGRRIRLVEREQSADWRTVVGVAGDVRQTHTDSDLDDVYVPFMQAPSRYASIHAATAQPQTWIGDVRANAAAIDPHVLVTDDVTGSSSLAREVERLLATPRFLRTLLLAFAAFATLLTMLGVHAVTAYAVGQRERELAIRAALGANRRQLALLFVRDAALFLSLGVGAGLVAATAVGRLLRSQLHGVSTTDLPTLIAAGCAVAIVGLFASWWPAARAAARSRLDILNEA